MSRALHLLLVPLLAACPSDAPITGEDQGDTGAAESSGGSPPPVTTGGATEPTTGGTGEPATGTTEPGFDPPVPMCGNGYLEEGEECDDGNVADDDGCTSACQIPCGLEREMIELAPSAQSEIGGLRVLGAADGGVIVVGNLQEITLDMEGKEDKGPRQILVVAYDAEGAKRWERTLGPDEGDLDPAGGAVHPNGDVFVAGSIDGTDGVDVWVARLAAADGANVWAAVHDGLLAGSDDRPGGLAVTPEGDVVVSAQVFDAEDDSDAWLRKLKGSNGNALWTTTWTGDMNDDCTVDHGRAVAVDADGNVLAMARECVNFKRHEATLLKFGPDGGSPLWTAAPLADGSDHTHEPGGVVVDANGDVLFIVGRYGAGQTFWVFKYSAAGDLVWEMAQDDFVTEDDEWYAEGVALASDGDVLLGGYWFNLDERNDTGWYETWMGRYDGEGMRRCQVNARGVGEDLVPPYLIGIDVGAGQGGDALVTGQRVENGELSLWTAVFRPL